MLVHGALLQLTASRLSPWRGRRGRSLRRVVLSVVSFLACAGAGDLRALSRLPDDKRETGSSTLRPPPPGVEETAAIFRAGEVFFADAYAARTGPVASVESMSVAVGGRSESAQPAENESDDGHVGLADA